MAPKAGCRSAVPDASLGERAALRWAVRGGLAPVREPKRPAPALLPAAICSQFIALGNATGISA